MKHNLNVNHLRVEETSLGMVVTCIVSSQNCSVMRAARHDTIVLKDKRTSKQAVVREIISINQNIPLRGTNVREMFSSFEVEITARTVMPFFSVWA